MKDTRLFYAIIPLSILFISNSSCSKINAPPIITNGWDVLGDLSPDSGLSAIAADHNYNIYVAGKFSSSADEYHVAKWNGNIWSELGSLNAHSYISCLAVYGDNVFASVDTGSGDSSYVSEWDGSSWKRLTDTASGKSIIGHISKLAMGNYGDLYALVSNNEIDMWTGGTWVNLTGTDSLFKNCNITSLTVDIGGRIFTGINPGSAYEGVAEWNGTWSMLGTYHPNNKILVLASDINDNIYAGGSFTDKGHNTYVARWDGTSWLELTGLNSLNTTGEIRCMVTDINANIYVCGYLKDDAGNYYVARWNGRSWAELNTGVIMNAPILSMTIDKSGSIYIIAYSSSYKKYFVAVYSL